MARQHLDPRDPTAAAAVSRRNWVARTLLLSALALGSTGCAPLLVGGVASGASFADRRTVGAQVDDQAIELKARQRLDKALGLRHNVGVTSFNRVLLVSGSVPTENERTAAMKAVEALEGVAGLYGEVVVRPGEFSVANEARDSLLTAKVKTALLGARDLPMSAVKVVTSDSVVYLMGRATERERQRAAETAREVPGVQRVILVMEPITDADLARMGR